MESYAQRDPLVRYKGQASTMFTELLKEVRQTVISRMFRYRPTNLVENQIAPRGLTPTESAEKSIPGTPDQAGALNKETAGSSKKRRKRH